MTEGNLFDWLGQPDLQFGPVKLQGCSIKSTTDRGTTVDAVVEARWKDRVVRYAGEVTTLSTPKSIQAAVLKSKQISEELNLFPLIIVPYLREEKIKELESQNVSGLDLNGNGVLIGPDFSIWRTGNPNQFRDAVALRNIYSGDSSIFVRCFLLQDKFASLQNLRGHAEQNTRFRGGAVGSPLRLGTASKVVEILVQDLLVRKGEGEICLVDSRRLMENLVKGYKPRSSKTVLGKTQLAESEVWKRLAQLNIEQGNRYAASGIASAGYYKVLSGVGRLSLYVDDIAPLLQILEIKEGRTFANIELIEAEKNLPYFDLREEGDALWASPIQTWLELAQGGPRESEAASAMAESILKGRRAQ